MTQITNVSTSTIYVVGLGRTLGPGESVEISDADASAFANHPLLRLSSQPTPIPTPISGANVAPTVPTEDTAEPESTIEKES